MTIDLPGQKDLVIDLENRSLLYFYRTYIRGGMKFGEKCEFVSGESLYYGGCAYIWTVRFWGTSIGNFTV